jgi:Lrp/AsnC family transcriptional regulator
MPLPAKSYQVVNMSKTMTAGLDSHATHPSGTWYGPPASTCAKHHEGEARMTDGLDRIDRKILAVLQEDGSLSAAEVAEAVGLSQSPCWRRIQRLKEAGYISKIVAILDRKKLDLRAQLFVHVKVSSNDTHNLQKFSQAIRAFPEVLECHVILGVYDFLLRVVAADMEAYQKFFSEKLCQIPNIREVNSFVAVTEVKSTTAFPLQT